MIVFDLKCAGGHVFEAWFASSAAWKDQQARGLVMCPYCGGTEVAKAVMAPNVAAKSNRADAPAAPVQLASLPDEMKAKAMMAAIAKVQAEVLKDSTWVGDKFDTQARAMDAGETPKKSIHGQVTKDQAASLMEDGIGVMPLLVPIVPPEERN